MIDGKKGGGAAAMWGLAVLLAAAGSAEGDIFVDRAVEQGVDFLQFNGMSGELYFVEMTGAGTALFDYDRDGDLDVYLTQGHMLGKDKTLEDAIYPPKESPPFTDRLYRNDLALGPDGDPVLQFVDVTEQIGLQATGYGMGVGAGDYDNDGWTDLYVTNLGSNHMLHNNGDGTFTDVIEEMGTDDQRWSVPVAFIDYDHDGWLDLYVGNYTDFRLATHKTCASATGQRDYCGPLAYKPEPDRLFHNRGDGTFEDVSARSNTNSEYGGALGVVGADFNGDTKLDLYVANDQLPNQMWVNQGDGTFVNEALFAGSAVNEEGKPEASMGVVAGDFNGDGYEDIFMTHITRETNTLFVNDGQGLFMDTTRDSGLGMSSWKFTGFGTVLVDFDNDGWQDLYICNGAVKTIPELARENHPYPLLQTNQLFHNEGGGQFKEISETAGAALAVEQVSRGVATGDLDLDGDTDLMVANNMGPAQMMMNEVGAENHHLRLKLYDRETGRDLLGTRAAVFKKDGSYQWRRSGTDGSYASAQSPELLIGLGGEGEIDRTRIEWPDGAVEEWHGLPVDKTYDFFRDAREDS